MFGARRKISALVIGLLAALTVVLSGCEAQDGSLEGETITVEGTVAEFNIRNPHSFINIEVTDEEGNVTRWGGEWGGVTQLSQGGVNRFTLKIGDRIVIDGAPPRDPNDNKLLVRRVVRPATDTDPEFVWQGRVQ